MANLLLLTQLLLNYSDKIAQIGTLLATAQAEGRDVTKAELDTLFDADDAAKAALDQLIAAS